MPGRGHREPFTLCRLTEPEQCLLKPVITATPTPGSLAFGEGGYIGFFAAFLPAHFVGVSLILWRAVLYFAPMFVGGTLVAKRIGRRGFDVRQRLS